jgi:porin
MQGFSKKIAARNARLPAALCLGMTVGGMAMAAEAKVDTASVDNRASLDNPVVSGRSSKKHKEVKKVKSVYRGPSLTGPVYKDAPIVATPPIEACSQQSAAALDKKYNLHAWVIPKPNFADSVTVDYGCWRTAMAKAGFGLMAYSYNNFLGNTLSHYVPPKQSQVYNGQRFSTFASQNAYLTYDLSQFGIPDGQLAMGGQFNRSTNINILQNTFNMSRLAYYQTAFDRKVEINFGYLEMTKEFQGYQVGGNIAVPSGPGATLNALVGLSSIPGVTPAFLFKYNFTDNFYTKAGIARSLVTTSPGGSVTNSILAETKFNPSGFEFDGKPYIYGVPYTTPRVLFVDEIGYQQRALPGTPYTWIRANAVYNTTPYINYTTGTPANAFATASTATNYNVSIFIDRQIWQSEPESPLTAYKGVYLGGNAGKDNTNVSAYAEDYSARLYTFGLFGRPRDQISLVYERQVVSPAFADAYNRNVCFGGLGACARHFANNYSLLYTANINRGIYLTFGATYTDHPSPIWSPVATASYSTNPLNINHSTNFTTSLFVNF